MLDEDKIGDLVVQWGQAWEQGHELSVDELCLDHPTLRDEVADRIQSVKAMGWLNDSDDDDSDDDFIYLPDFTTVSGHANETKLPECSLTVEEFCQRLISSRLMDEEQVGQLKQRIVVNDARSFAVQLVSDKLLTRFQATVLLEGRDIPLVLDRYVLLGEIGAGGMGAVYKALHQQMDRVVALKILPKETVDSPDKVKRFQREVKAAAKLEHPNIVTAFDATESNGTHFLVMSYVNGSDLSQTVRKHGVVSTAKAVSYITQAASGLEHAHSMGIVHRDIKPGNLLLDKQGKVQILDMGLARFETADAEHDKTVTHELTQAGMVMGTVAYLAPEQALDSRHADGRSDIYALGCTLYYLLTGKALYIEDTMMKTIMAHRETDIPSLCEERDDVPAELDAIYQKMVAKQPEDRFQTMTEVIAALDALDIEDDEVAQSVVVVSPKTHETATFVETSRDVIEPQPETEAPTPPKRRWPLIAAALLGIVGLVWAASIFIKVDTPAGTIVLEIDDPDAIGAVVTVDGKTITIDQKGQLPIEVTADEKEHLLKVTKGGFETFTAKFSLGAGAKKNVRVRLEPLQKEMAVKPSPVSAPMTDKEIAKWVISIGGHINLPNHNRYMISKGDIDKGVVLPDDYKMVCLVIHKDINDDGMSRLLGLQHLWFVNLEGNPSVTDVTFSFLKNSTSLETLNLSDTNTTGSWLGEMKSLSSLTSLDLNATKFNQDNLVHLNKLTSLQDLRISGTGLTDKGLAQLSGLVNLKSLDLAANPISNDGLKVLAAFTKLEELKLYRCRVDDAGLEWLLPLKNLKLLDLSSTKITAAGLESLKAMTNLNSLNLWSTQVSDTGLEHLKGLTNLTSLYLRLTQVSDDGLEHLKGLTNLTALNLLETKVTAQGIANLKNALPKCEITWDGPTDTPMTDREVAEWVIGLGGFIEIVGGRDRFTKVEELPTDLFEINGVNVMNVQSIKDDALKRLAGLNALTTLNFSSTSISDKGLQYLKDMKHTELNLLALNNTKITDVGLTYLKDISSLKHLYIVRTAITNNGLQSLSGMKQIVSLHLAGLRIDDVGFRHLADLTNVEVLAVHETQMSDAGMKYVASMKKLRTLSLSSTLITDSGLLHLADSENLTELSLNSLKVSDSGLKHLKGLTNLRHLYLNDTKVTAQGIADLKKTLPKCEITWDGPTDMPMTDREVAEWVIGIGGAVKGETKPEITKSKIDEGAVIPDDFKMVYLDLSKAMDISEHEMSHLLGLQHLRSAVLSHANVTDMTVSYLKNSTSLEQLNLRLTNTTGSWMAEMKSLSSLTNLNLNQTKFNHANLLHIEKLTNLQELYIGNTDLTDDRLARLKVLVNLTHLDIGGNLISNDGLSTLAAFSKIEQVTLTNSVRVDDAGLESVLTLKKLKSLFLDGTKITDMGLERLVVMTNLTHLVLSRTQVTDNGLEHLKVMPNLTRLDLRNTKVTAQGIADLKKALPKCEISGP